VFELNRVHFPAEVHELRRSVRWFLEDTRATGLWQPQVNAWLTCNPEFSRRCGAAGFIGLPYPPEFGGRSASALERFAVFEEMVAAGAPVGYHWIADRQSGPQILKYGHPTLKARILPSIAAGQCCIGIGMSEPDAGSDLAAVRSRGRRTEGGWILSGAKVWTSLAHCAHYLIILVRTEPQQADKRHAGLTQFVLDMTTPGITVRPIADLTGDQHFNEVLLDNVFVPDYALLGEPGQGWQLVNAELAWERSGPERYLSTLVLLESFATWARMHAASDVRIALALGRAVSHLTVLRHLSAAIAGMLDGMRTGGRSPDVEAALVKDLGGIFERDIPEWVRTLVDMHQVTPELRALQAAAVLSAPSFTLRGGTREILRGIVARSLAQNVAQGGGHG